MKQKITFIQLFLLALILLLAAYLRLTNLAENPGWHTDEGTWLNIDRNLLKGQTSYMAFDGSILISARMPLFGYVLAGVSELKGYGIETLRFVTAVLGIISVALLYIVLRQIDKTWFPLLAALLYAIYPNAVLYSRVGFSYNLLTPLVLLLLLCLWKYIDTRRRIWLAVASLIVGIGTTSDLMMTTVLPVLVLVVLVVRWRDIFFSLPLMLAPFGVFVLIGLVLWGGDFSYDLAFLLLRAGEISIFIVPVTISINLQFMLLQDAWITAGLIGLFMVENKRLQKLLLLLFLVPFIGIARIVVLNDISFYYLIPLFPLTAIGLAALLQRGTVYMVALLSGSLASLYDRWGWTLAWLRTRLISVPSALFVYLLVISPFLIITWMTIYEANHRMETYFDLILVEPDDVRAAADYVNAHTTAQDVVLASPGVAWLIDGKVADFQVALAADGKQTKHFPDDIPAHRFSFDARFAAAKYVVVDPLWRNWGVPNLSDLEDMLNIVETWPLVFHSGEIDVYRNPSLTP